MSFFLRESEKMMCFGIDLVENQISITGIDRNTCMSKVDMSAICG